MWRFPMWPANVRDGHIAGSPKSRKSSLWGVEKCQKYCDFLIFSKKICFFVAQKGMLIHRFPHSLGVWGCWGRSKSIDFAIFRVLGTPNREVPAISCPHCCYFRSIVTRRKILLHLCDTLRSPWSSCDIDSFTGVIVIPSMMTVHSIFWG